MDFLDTQNYINNMQFYLQKQEHIWYSKIVILHDCDQYFQTITYQKNHWFGEHFL